MITWQLQVFAGRFAFYNNEASIYKPMNPFSQILIPDSSVLAKITGTGLMPVPAPLVVNERIARI